MNKIAIISHTEHYINKEGKVVGWEPTIREINQFTSKFKTIYHLAPLHLNAPHRTNLAYSSNRIIFKPLIPSGGKTLFKKIGIMLVLPINLIRIIRVIHSVDWIHFRAPTSLGLFVLPLLCFFYRKKMWVKYAGNWQQKSIPLSYKLQRWWLQKNFNRSSVIINGVWKDQKSHLLSFHNPCLTDEEMNYANQVGLNKDFTGLLNICFVGRSGLNKGANKLLESFSSLSGRIFFNEVNFIGVNAVDLEVDYNESNFLKVYFKGWLSRSHLNKIYAKSHIIILPTKSEGFPKVIAEASAFGCIPVVTNLEPINQIIINRENGILLEKPKVENIKKVLLNLKNKDYDLKGISNSAIHLSKFFTYKKYLDRINNEIFNESN